MEPLLARIRANDPSLTTVYLGVRAEHINQCRESLLILTCMQHKEIGEEGAVALARAVELNSSITTLDVGVCGGEEGGRKEGRCSRRYCCLMLTLHAEQHDRRRRSDGVGEGAGAQQLYHYAGC